MLAPEDFWHLHFVKEMQLSPDGHRLACTVEWNDREANERHAAIWLFDRETGEMRQLTAGRAYDSLPRWSPDGGKLAFLSNRDGSETQLYCLPLAGGEAERLTRMRLGAD
jgi:Tol biopolymer transport system component